MNKIFKYVLIFSTFFFTVSLTNVNASVKLGGQTLNSSSYAVLEVGNRNFVFGDGSVTDFASWKKYFLITLCTDSNNITSWYATNNSLDQINFTNTNYKCMFPNSTYTGGHIVYVVGNTNFDYGCGVGTSCQNGGTGVFYVPNKSSWSILNESYSDTPVNIDYASMSIVTNDKTIIDQNKLIIEQQKNIYNRMVQQTDKINDSINNSDTSGAKSDASNFFNNFDDNDYGLSDIVKMPLTFINNITSAQCTPLSFPLPFVDTNVTLPCMYDIYNTHFPNILVIYQTITFGIVAYWVCINIFRMVKNFKNPDNDEVEVLDL